MRDNRLLNTPQGHKQRGVNSNDMLVTVMERLIIFEIK